MQTKTAHSTRKAPGFVRRQSTQTHEIRIIGGHWKRIKLKVADRPGLRPTPDRVRETLFNWLGQNLSGMVCVDAFAGTGALGFEAASRGAREVLLVEQDASLVVQLQKVQTQLQTLVLPEPVTQTLRIQRGEGVAALRQLASASQNVIFLDPPFDGNLYEQALRAASRALAPNGSIYLEAPKCWTDADLAPFGLQVSRHLKAGVVHAHVLHALIKARETTDTTIPSGVGGAA
jgi:16S rRNA (guanine(966)-N(2))-methyltransferase RsmD